LMCPVTCTCPAPPGWTSMVPEPVVICRCTGPETCRVRWNEPSEDALAGKLSRQAAPNRTKPMRELIGGFIRFSAATYNPLLDPDISRTSVHSDRGAAAADLPLYRFALVLQIPLDGHGDRLLNLEIAGTGGCVEIEGGI